MVRTALQDAASIAGLLITTEAMGEGRLTVDAEVRQSARSVEIDTVHLPETPYERLVGRDEELKRLDETWSDPAVKVFSLVGEGGTGKSALVNKWLTRMQADNYRGADAVLGWSFYSQGSKERATSADQFLNWSIAKLGINLTTTSASAKGEAIAEALAERRVLLILDGVEPLQHGPGSQPGQLKDLGMCALLRRFAAMPPREPHGLIVITSRLAVADIARWKDTAAPVLDVEELSDEAGAALLRDNGVWGTDRELKAASHDFGGHPLALGLLASFLQETQFGDVRRRDHIRDFFADPENPRHDHAKRVMESYEQEWLKDQPVLLGIMHMVGLFDRPASGDCLKALRQKPAIKGLTDAIVGIEDAKWWRAVACLREVRLLSPQDKSAPETLDAHPLVREWFGESLRTKNGTAWRAAHSRLFDHLRRATKEGDQPTFEQLDPLYQAIAHGCRAGRYLEALEKIYRDRICRRLPGGIEFYNLEKLGAFGSSLAAISWFFDKPYDKPVTTLSEQWRSWVLSQASTCLEAQGRLAESLQANLVVLDMEKAAKRWGNAARCAGNLSWAELRRGEVAFAVTRAEQAVRYADDSSYEFAKMAARVAHAHALHAAGREGEAEALFADAELRNREIYPFSPLLVAQHGYQYCDLLLAKGAWEAARERGAQTLKSCNWVRDVAFGKLTLGRANLGLALAGTGQSTSVTEQRHDFACSARAGLDEAVEGLRASGRLYSVALGLLARAVFRRSNGDWLGAARDLDEVEEIAELGPMKIYLCDMAIERARLAFAQIEAFAPLNGLLETDHPPKPAPPSADGVAGLKREAAAQLKIGENYVATCGYHKRDEELAELEAVLAGLRRFAGLPPRV